MLAFTLCLPDADALRALFDEQLALGRAFVPGAGGAAALTACELVLEQGGRTHRLAAEVVFVKEEEPGRGVGLQLAALDPDAMASLRGFVELAPDAGGEPAPVSSEAPADEDADGDEPRAAAPDSVARNLQERLRSLSSVEQQKVAAGGTLTERVALERMYGPNVWETLLRNPRLTIPEVARIGRKGTLPRPLVESIAANASWLATGEVQRALLSNPRSSQAVVIKVLQMLSRPDLQLVPQQTAYPPIVRQTAKRMLGKS